MSLKFFTDEQLEYIKENYATSTKNELVLGLGQELTKLNKNRMRLVTDQLGLRKNITDPDEWRVYKWTNQQGEVVYNRCRLSKDPSDKKNGRREYEQWVRWEEKHGKIPPNHMLRCIDGNRLNTDPSNWYLVSQSGHLRDNTCLEKIGAKIQKRWDRARLWKENGVNIKTGYKPNISSANEKRRRKKYQEEKQKKSQQTLNS